jgi:hypothetical protein
MICASCLAEVVGLQQRRQVVLGNVCLAWAGFSGKMPLATGDESSAFGVCGVGELKGQGKKQAVFEGTVGLVGASRCCRF